MEIGFLFSALCCFVWMALISPPPLDWLTHGMGAVTKTIGQMDLAKSPTEFRRLAANQN